MAAAPSPLTRNLWTQLTKVKLLNASNNLKQGKFFYETSSFDHSEDDNPEDCAQNAIVGKLWLTSNIYRNHALRIELHLPSSYPMQPPEVIITTPIYHPNVNEQNRLCDERLTATALWDNKTTLIGVLEIIVDALDNPQADNKPANPNAAQDFTQNRAEYERKATAMIQQNGLPRS